MCTQINKNRGVSFSWRVGDAERLVIMYPGSMLCHAYIMIHTHTCDIAILRWRLAKKLAGWLPADAPDDPPGAS